MGLIGTVIEFLRGDDEGQQVIDVKFDPGGEDNATAAHYQPAGVDSVPLADDYMAVVKSAGTGRWVVVGYLDPVNEGTAVAGEHRLYSRDSGGAVVVTLRLAADGFVHLGEDTGAALIARADKVDAELALVSAALDTVANGGGALTGANPYTEPGATGCDKVKGT